MSLVWERETWWTEHLASKADWWRVRRSEDDSAMLAYHLTEAHALADRWTKTKPGRYLTAHTSLTQKEVKFWAEWHIKGERPADDDEPDSEVVQFASTPDEIEEVYLDGPSSCMSHQADSYESSEHPVRVYGAGDLAIAWLPYRDNDEDYLGRRLADRPRVKARALCWPERKVYGRVYPDDCYPEGAALVHALQAVGYSHARIHDKGFNGARLLRIECEDRNGRDGWVMPYLDSPCRNFDDDGDYLIMRQNGEFNAEETDGVVTSEEEYEYHCDWCEDGFNGGGSTVFSSVNRHGGRNERYICPSCAESENVFRCAGFDEYFDSGHVSYDEWQGETYTCQWLEDNTFISDFSGERFSGDDMVTMHNGYQWAEEELDGNAVPIDGEWWPTDDADAERERRAANADTRNGMLALSMGEP